MSAPITSTATRPTSAAIFFQRMQDTMPENWLLFIAEHAAEGGNPGPSRPA